ncbi:MAG: alpha/beta hydrolase [Erysipelotrichaceae bacterium]|nr:alpha/beta hydrolase [Erysipelotrichaceae bacterium]
MNLKLYLAIRNAKKYMKEHNHPGRMIVTEKDLEDWRQRIRTMDKDCYTVDEKLKQGLNIEKVDLPNTSSWLISKEGNPKDKILYHIHGGGFINGCTKMLFPFYSYVVNNWGYNVFAIDYRLAPDYHCIDTITDCEDGYKYLLEHYSPDNIILMGESAGGNLVLGLPHILKDDGLPLPKGIISDSPVVQFVHYPYSYYENACKTDFGIIFGINEALLGVYPGELPVDHPYLSPLCGDLSGYPPVYLDASDKESLRDEARMMYVRLKEEGCDVEYHELKDFFHAQMTNVKSHSTKKKQYPLILAFIHRLWG